MANGLHRIHKMRAWELFQFDFQEAAFLDHPAGLTAMRDAPGPGDVTKLERLHAALTFIV